jgi:L-alanine-DL-glutamate epimerase-like enolase superfamily enzyme
MRVTGIRHMAVPLAGAVSNAMVSFERHTVSLVVILTDQVRHGRPVYGAAFNSIGRFDQSGILSTRIVPRIIGADPESLLHEDGVGLDPASVRRVAMTDEKPGGHGDRASAIAAVELAAWDLNAKLADEPAYATIARAHGRPVPHDPGVPTYAAGGYYCDADTVDEQRDLLVSELKRYRAAGYTSFKIKIGGAPMEVDLARVEAAIEIAGDAANVAVDANGRFAVEDGARWAKALAPYGLRWLEEPCDPLDFETLRAVAAAFGGPVATGENLFSRQDVVNLLRYAGLRQDRDVLQMDAGLSYGLTEYAGMVAAMEDFGMSRAQAVPHGGHLVNLHIVAGLGLGACESYPGVFAPFGGYGTAPVTAGLIHATDASGFGLEQKADLAAHLDRLTAA